MALVTYTLLCALASGLQSRFHPEVLGLSLSKALAVVITEFCAIKLGCYLLDVRGSGASGVELVGYGGYKFVGIIATIVVSLLGLGKMITLGVFIYTLAANAFFLVSCDKILSSSSLILSFDSFDRSNMFSFLTPPSLHL